MCFTLSAMLCSEFLRRLRSTIQTNRETPSTLTDGTIALEPENTFFASLPADEAAVMERNADRAHAGNMLRLLHERRRRQELHNKLQSARAEQAVLRV
jgi:hypothetical protein